LGFDPVLWVGTVTIGASVGVAETVRGQGGQMAAGVGRRTVDPRYACAHTRRDAGVVERARLEIA
jgi:hypothetical protein